MVHDELQEYEGNVKILENKIEENEGQQKEKFTKLIQKLIY